MKSKEVLELLQITRPTLTKYVKERLTYDSSKSWKTHYKRKS